MADKVTIMVLKVDLHCPCCYKKVKKILCKFPQIRDQIYNEKANTVRITVVCCDPLKVRDKLCCKGAKVIKSIEIMEPEPKPTLQKPDVKPLPATEKLNDPPESAVSVPVPTPTPPPERVQIGGYVYPPVRTCCGPCSEGYGGGPCYFGFGVAAPPQPCFEGYGYRERPYHVTRCDYYFSEENPQACSIM